MDSQNPQQPVQSFTPQVEPPAPTAKSSLWWKIVLGVVLLILIGGGGYFLGTTKSQTAQNTNSSITTQPTLTVPKNVVPTIADPTANWKTYANTVFNYSIKYPPDWTVQENNKDDPKNTIVTINSNEKFSTTPNDLEPVTYWVNISNYPNPQSKDFKSLVTQDLVNPLKTNFTYTTETINGSTVYRTTDLPSMSGCDFVFFKKTDNGYIDVNFCLYSKEKPYPNQDRFYKNFNQILQTFKLTDQTIDATADWKTYTNSQYGFQITYPAKGVSATDAEIECGKSIIDKDTSTITFDSFFLIRIIGWQGTITDYITNQNVTNLYVTTQILGTNAEEAVGLGTIPNSYKGEGYPPLSYVTYMFRKKNMLFLLMGMQNPGNGCIPPSLIDKSTHPTIIKNWDIGKNFKFTN